LEPPAMANSRIWVGTSPGWVTAVTWLAKRTVGAWPRSRQRPGPGSMRRRPAVWRGGGVGRGEPQRLGGQWLGMAGLAEEPFEQPADRLQRAPQQRLALLDAQRCAVAGREDGVGAGPGGLGVQQDAVAVEHHRARRRLARWRDSGHGRCCRGRLATAQATRGTPGRSCRGWRRAAPRRPRRAGSRRRRAGSRTPDAGRSLQCCASSARRPAGV
jgi:hypothetical protein